MSSHTYDIPAILDRLPEFTLLFERDGHTPHRSGGGWFVACPFHDERSPSCNINNERQKFHCYGCGASGDPFDYWQKSRDLSFQDALEQLASIAGVGPSTATSQPVTRTPRPSPAAAPVAPLSGPALTKWHAATQHLLADPAEIHRIATWRGIEPAAVAFAAARGLIGSYSYWGIQREAFLVEMPSPSGLLPVSVHIRLAPGTKGNEDSRKASWRYDPGGCGSWPWVVGDLATAKHIFLLEGQWDALALISMMGWHTAFPKNVAIAGLRGATSIQKLLLHPINPKAYIFAMADADGAGAKWFEEKGLLNTLAARLENQNTLHAFWPDQPGSDFNDMVKSGAFTRDIMLLLILPHLPAKAPLPAGPTFTQWCRRHAKDISATGLAASHVIADRSSPKGHRPLSAWMQHWNLSGLPPDVKRALHEAWDAYRANPSS